MYQFVEVLKRLRVNRLQTVLAEIQVLQLRNGSEELVGYVADVIYGQIQLEEIRVVFKCIFMKARNRIATQIQQLQLAEPVVRPCFNSCEIIPR